jgi:hypothetical protein
VVHGVDILDSREPGYFRVIDRVMASKGKRKKGQQRGRQVPLTIEAAKKRAAFRHGQQPTPIQGIERQRRQQTKWLKARTDEFSQTLSQLVSTRRDGDRLRLRASLNSATQARLTDLATNELPHLQDELRGLTNQIRDVLRGGDPTFLVCWVSFWNSVGIPGKYFEPTDERSEAKVEFASGLAAGLPHRAELPPDPAAAQRLLGLIDEAFQVSMLLLMAEGAMEPDPVKGEIRYRSRLYSLFVRGDTYVEYGHDLARNLFEPETDWMKKEFGFSISDAIVLEGAVTSLVERRLGELLTALSEAMDDAREVIRDRHAPPSVKRVLSRVGKQGLLESYFTTSLANGILAAMTFSVEELLVAPVALGSDTVKSLLSAFSITRVDEYSSPLERSPLIDGPILPAGERYLAPVVGLIGRDISDILERQVLKARPKFSKRRAKILDSLAVEYLAGALPEAQTWTSLHYPLTDDPRGEQAECDAIVVWNDVCFVLEGKGKPLSPQSKRGDVRRIHSDLEASLVDAWNQGNRVVAYLDRGDPAVFYDDRRREKASIAPSSFSFVKVITPTVHSLADHALHLERFSQMGLDVNGPPPWAVYINDLRMICELVRSPAELVCYLRWRDRLHLGRTAIAVDEADVFGAFLLRASYANADGIIQIGSHSTDFDAYYMGQDAPNSPVEKPEMFSTPFVDEFLDRLVSNRPSGWIEAADVVLTLSLEQLALVDHAGPLLAKAAAAKNEVVSHQEFRVTVLGIPRAASLKAVTQVTQSSGPRVIVALGRSGDAEIAWALTG